MPIRAVIFDLGGVLVRTEDRTPRQQLAERLNMTYEELAELVFDSQTAVQASLGKVSTQAHWENVRAALGLPAEEFPAMPEGFWGGDALDAELVDYIRGLRPRYKTGLLSNAWDDLREVLENRWKIADAFDVVIISAEVGLVKPDPGIYRLALERLEVEPEEAVFVDDFPHNVQAARRLGMQAIQFLGPQQTRAELERVLKKTADH